MNPGCPSDLSPHGADPHPVGPVGGDGQPPGLRDPRLGVHPPFDPELAAVLAARPQLSVSLLARHIPKLREAQLKLIEKKQVQRLQHAPSRQAALPLNSQPLAAQTGPHHE